jgi:hypothetical protein
MRVRQLEDRTVPSAFIIPNGDVTALINAINTANSDGKPDTIILAPGGEYQITQANNNTNGANALPVITSHNLTMQGSGATIESASGNTSHERFFDIGRGANVVLENLTLTGGSEVGATAGAGVQGGAVFNGGGTLTLQNLLIQRALLEGANATGPGTAGGSALGGGVFSSGGHITLINTHVLRCSVLGGAGGPHAAGGSAQGGGVYVQGGQATFVACNLSGNSLAAGQGGIGKGSGHGGKGGDADGAGLYASGATVLLYNTAVQSNFAFAGNGGRVIAAVGVNGAPGQPGGPGGSGGHGGAGGNTFGAGVYVNNGHMALLNGSVSRNQGFGGKGGSGLGGNGGNGGAGVSPFLGGTNNGGAGSRGGAGGLGGLGGEAAGAGLYATNATVTVADVLLENNSAVGGAGGQATGGLGGRGGVGGNGNTTGSPGGRGGNGGSGQAGGFGRVGGAANGGGLYQSGGSLGLTQSTVRNNSVQGGRGGNAGGGMGGAGGAGGTGYFSASGGNGGNGSRGGRGGQAGNGGNGEGGGLFIGAGSTAIVTGTTPQGDSASAGAGGSANAGLGGAGGPGGPGGPSAVGGPNFPNGSPGKAGANGPAGTPGRAGTAQGQDVQGTTTAGTPFAVSGRTVTNVLQGNPTGSVLLATFAGGPSESSASAYQAFVHWSDGTFDSSTATAPNVTIVLSNGVVEVFGTHTFASGGAQSANVTLWVPGNVGAEAIAKIDVATNVTSQASITSTKPAKDPSTGLYGSNITVSNPAKGSAISGSLDLLLSGLPAGVTLKGASVTINGTTFSSLPIDHTSTGAPYVHIPTADLSSLAPGQSIVLHVAFQDPTDVPITFTTSLFSDPFDC